MGLSMLPFSASPRRCASRATGSALAFALLLATSGCELTEVTLAEPTDLVVAEVLIQHFDTTVLASALLYATQGSKDPGRVRDARVVLTPEGEDAVVLPRVDPSQCLDFVPREPVTEAACYASRSALAHLGPERHVDLTITLPDGAEIRGSTRTVGAFDVAGRARMATGPGGLPLCYLPAETPFELTWTRSEGAWGYIIESWLHGLPKALAAEGITTRQDPLLLIGVSLAASDTTIVFPSQVGLAERLDDDNDVLRALQDGLPAGASATIYIVAADRNFVRWFRGASFNPVGAERISSLTGDGFGYFGSTAMRGIAVTTALSSDVPRCIE